MDKNKLLTLLSRLMTPVLLIVLGLVLLVNPDSASALAAKVLGWVLVIAGIGFGIGAVTRPVGTAGKVLGAVVCLALGVWLLRNPLALAAGIGRFAGILLVIRAVQDLLWERRALPVITLVIGVVLILLPMTTSRVVLSLCGVAVAALGVIMLLQRLKEDREPTDFDGPDIIDAL